MTIRRAELRDAANISRFIRQLTKEFIVKDCTKEGAETLLRSMRTEIIKSQLLAGDAHFLVEEDDRLVGVIGLKSNNHLVHLYVDKTHQNRGAARSLWEKLVAFKNPQVCTITVNSSLNAIGFYQKMGFIAESSGQVKNGIPSIPLKITIN